MEEAWALDPSTIQVNDRGRRKREATVNATKTSDGSWSAAAREQVALDAMGTDGSDRGYGVGALFLAFGLGAIVTGTVWRLFATPGDLVQQPK